MPIILMVFYAGPVIFFLSIAIVACRTQFDLRQMV